MRTSTHSGPGACHSKDAQYFDAMSTSSPSQTQHHNHTPNICSNQNITRSQSTSPGVIIPTLRSHALIRTHTFRGTACLMDTGASSSATYQQFVLERPKPPYTLGLLATTLNLTTAPNTATCSCPTATLHNTQLYGTTAQLPRLCRRAFTTLTTAPVSYTHLTLPTILLV